MSQPADFKRLVFAPTLEIASKEDGVFLHFETATGRRAMINLSVFFADSRVLNRTIVDWASEYASLNPPKP